MKSFWCLRPGLSGDVASDASVLLWSCVSCVSCFIFLSLLWLVAGSCLTFAWLCVVLGVGGVDGDGGSAVLVGVMGDVGGVMRSMQGADFVKKRWLSPEDCGLFLLMIRLSVMLFCIRSCLLLISCMDMPSVGEAKGFAIVLLWCVFRLCVMPDCALMFESGCGLFGCGCGLWPRLSPPAPSSLGRACLWWICRVDLSSIGVREGWWSRCPR